MYRKISTSSTVSTSGGGCVDRLKIIDFGLARELGEGREMVMNYCTRAPVDLRLPFVDFYLRALPCFQKPNC